MELELGLKITRTREDVSSSVDFRFSKDPFGPLLLSRETDSRFIVIIHLKGFKKEGIEIEINEEGNKITISGRKPVEEMVIVRWMAWRKEVELRAFRKVFRIPDIVDLDKIKARFDEDDMTLTITMPKRVKGISGFEIEEEEEEERVDFGDVSEIDHRGELESVEGEEESDEHLETFEESQGEEFGEMMGKERESEVLEDEAKGFNGGVEEEEDASAEIGEGVIGQEEIEEVKKGKTAESDAKTEDDRNVQKTEEQGWSEPQRSEKQEKILESIEEEEEVGQLRLEEQEFVSSNTESEDSEIRKLSHIEGLDSHEQLRHDEEQENKQELVEQQILEAETKGDYIGTRAFEEIEQQEADELERTCDQGRGGEEKKKTEKNEVDAKLSKGVEENIDRAPVQDEEDIAESDCDVSKKRNMFDNVEADELADKREEEEEIGNYETKNEDNEEKQSKGQKRHKTQERIKELVEEKTSEAEIKIVKDTRKPGQGTEEAEVDRSERHEGKDKIKKMEYKIDDDDGSSKESGEPERCKEEIKTQEMVKEVTSHQGKGGEEKKTEIENEISKEDVDLKTNEGVPENLERPQVQEEEVISETETKPEADTSEKWHEFDKLEASEIDKTHEMVEEEINNQEEEEKQGVEAKSEGSSSLKLEEIEEQQPKAQKRHEKEEKVKELIEQKILEAEIENVTPKPVQEIAVPEKDMVERYKGKHKIQEHVQKEPSNHQEENKEKIMETGKKTNGAGEKRVQEIKQQELEGPKCEEDSMTPDLVKRRTNGEENEEEGIAEEIAAKETKGEDDISRQEEIEEVEEDKAAETDAKTEDDGKVHKTEEQRWSEPQRNEKQDKILEDIEEEEEEEAVGQQNSEEEEIVTSNAESEDSGLRKLPDIEGRDSMEQKRHDEEQEKNQEWMEQQVSEAETKSDDIVSRAFEETEQQEPDELKRTSKSGEEKETVGAREKSMNDDDDGSSKVQESVERKTGDQRKGEEEKKKIGKTKIKSEDVIEEIDAKMGKGAKENKERTQVQEKDDIAEVEGDVSEKWNVFDKLEADELVGKGEDEEEIGTGGTKREDNSSIMLQDNQEKQSKGLKRHEKRERIKELLEEKTSEAETKIVNDTRKPARGSEEPEVDRSERYEGKDKIKKMEYELDNDDGSSKESGQPERCKEEIKTQKMVKEETSDQGKGEEKKRNAKTEIKNEISKEDNDLKTEEGFTENIERTQVQGEENIAETETKTEVDASEKWDEFDKVEASEIDKRHELVEEEITNQEEEEKQRVGAKSEGSSLLKLEEIVKQQRKGQKRHDKQEKVEQKILEAEIENDTPKPGQEIAVPEKDMVDIYKGKHKIQEHVQKERSNHQKQNEEKIIETGKKTNDAGEKRVEEIKQQVLDEPRYEEDSKTQDLVKRQTNGEEKEKEGIAETETSEQESNRRKNLGEHNKIRNLDEDKKNSCKEEKIKEEEETTEKETKGEDDISRNVQDTEQGDSDTVNEEKLCDEGREGIAVTETVAKSDKSKKVQEIDKPDTIQAHDRYEQEEDMKERAKTRGIVANTGDDRPKKIKGVAEQELVNLNNQLKQDSMEDQEETQELVEKKMMDCKEEGVRKEKGSEEPKTKTNDDDVVRKVQGIEEQELYEPKRHPLSEMQELVEKKTGKKEEEKETTELEMEDEYGSLRKVPGIEEQELPEPNIHKERDKFRMVGREEPIGQEKEERENKKTIVSATITENDNALTIKKTKEKQSNKKEEKQQEKTEDYSAKKVQEIGKQEYDELNRSMVQGKMRETEEKDKTGAMEQKETVERGLKNKDGDLRKVQDGEDPELGKPKERGDECKIQKLVEMEKCDPIGEFKNKDEGNILGSQEAGITYKDEVERQGEQSNIPQLVEERMENIAEPVVKMKDDSSGKFDKLENPKSYEDWTHEDQEKIENLVKEEATDLRVTHAGGGYEEDAKTKDEDDIYKKVRENEDQGLDMKKRYIDKLEGLKGEGTSDHKKEEEDFRGKIQETESERHEKLDIVQEIMEDETGDQEDEVVEEDAAVVTKTKEAVNDNLKPVQDIKEPNMDISERHESKYESQELNQVEKSGHQEEKKEKLIETSEKSSDIGIRKVEEVRQQESDEPARCEETSKTQEMVESKLNDEEKEKKRIAETAKKREPFRPKILREQDKIQELVEEKKGFCKEEFAEKETKAEADMPRRDVEEQDSDAIKGAEEDQIQELVEELCDEGKATIVVEGEIAENDKSRNVQEMNEHGSHEVDAFCKHVKFPELKGGRISGFGDNEEEESKKMTIETDKKIMDSAREVEEIVTNESNGSGQHEKGDKMKELQEEHSENYKDEHEEQKDEEETRGKVANTGDDGSKKITGATEQELVNQDSQLEQENIKEREKTQELVEDKIKDYKEKEVGMDEGSEEPKNKTDDVLRKVQSIEEQELYEEIRPLSEMQELVEEKTGEKEEKEKTESEIEPECGSLRQEDGNEEQQLHEPNIHKEQGKIRIAEAEEPVRQEKEEDEKEKTAEPETIMESNNPTNLQVTKEDKPPKPVSHQKQHKIEELVEAGCNEHKVKQQKEKGSPKKKLEAEKDSAKNVQEIEKQEFDELKRAMVVDKIQEKGEEDKTRAMEEKETVESERKTRGGSLKKVRDGEDPELGKTKRHEEEEKIQELVEMERSGYGEEIKRKDKDESLRGQKGSCPDLNDIKNNIPQLVEEENMENIAEPEEKMEVDNSGKIHEFEERKSYEDWTDEEQENITNLVKEEATDPKDEHKGRGEENPVNDFTGKIQKEESHESDRQEKQNMVQEVLEEKSVDQRGAEKAAVVSSRKVQTIEELEEPEKQKEQIKVEPRDLEEKVKEEGRVELKETGREVPSSSEQGKPVETMPHERVKTKIEDRVEELKGKLVTENDSIRKGEKFSESELNGANIPKISIQHEDVQSKKLVGQEVNEEVLEDYDNARREKRREKAKASRIPENVTKANDDSLTQSKTGGQESTRLEGQKTKEDHQEMIEKETRDQRKEEKEDYVEKVETEAEHDSSRKIHETEEQKSKGKTSDCKEEKEGNRAGAVWGEGETKLKDDRIREIKEEELDIAMRYKEQDKKQSLVENDSSQTKETKHQESKGIGDSSRMIQDIENQEPGEQKSIAEQSKNQELVEQKTNNGRNQEDTNEDKETTEADDSREVKETKKLESPEVETHGNREREDKKTILTEFMIKEDPESKLHERPRKKDKIKEPVQHKTENLEDEGTTKAETKSKESESSKKQEIKEQETSDPRRFKEQERIKDKTDHYKEKDNKETESDRLQKIQEIDKEDSIQELLDKETSEDDEEELEIEFEDEEEEWEAEVIQAMDSDEENDKIREIRRIKVGFKLVGGSALFMSLIVIVIRFIHSKKKIKPYKF